ncbi:MAG: IS21 family transposase [Candidatus Symbiothrix sp.]|nr:IS21 family transposase [Candidatus Symbiothrix sp.]
MLKQLLRLFQQGNGIKKISRTLGMSKNTVKKYLHQVESQGLDVSVLLQKTDEEVESILLGKTISQEERLQELQKMFPDMEEKLKETGINLHYLWCKYKVTHPQGYEYSQFCYHYQKYRESSRAVMHFEHEAGDKLFLDYAGKKLSYVVYGTGEIIDCEFFIAVLGYSQYTYAEASLSQQKESFIESVQNAMHYFGGVPKVLVPDNLKSAVHKSCRYDPCLNEDFLSMANHYGCSILPTRSRKPRDKSLVERHVSILYTRVYAELSALTFFSLKDLNKAIEACINQHNSLLFQGKDYSRKQAFESVEKGELSPLPVSFYEIREYALATVMKNSHVRLGSDKHYYSVPYRYIGEKVKLACSSKEVSIFLKGERIAYHLRNRKAYGYTTLKEHLPSQHQFVSEWNPGKFIQWASKISPVVKEYIEKVLAQKSYPETLYRSCVGILTMEKKMGKERLIKACGIGLQMNTYNYGFISRILKNGTDKLLENESIIESQLPEHENIRGEDYYKKMCNN